MKPARLALPAFVVAAIAFGVVLLTSGGDTPYRMSLQMANAAGLREGSEVKVAGTPVGKVSKIELGRGDVVKVGLEIDRKKARVGRGATVAVRSANLLGQKFVDLRPGNTAAPAAPGVLLRGASITAPVDLDQVFAVLDADTRARLGVLINEAGTALLGRHADVSTLLRSLPSDLDRARQLMSDLTRDNRSLRQLVARSERFTSRLAPERRRLGDVVQVASGAMETLSARRTQMAATLQRAPRALTELRGFLDELRATTRPLGPAARTLSSTAPALKSTLDALEPFRVAATPTLDEAHAAAPALQRLADRATPVVKSAAPPVQSLSTLAQAAPPLTKALDASIDDVLGFVQGWARATQNRDGVGHYFQGQGIFGAEILRSAVNRLLAQAPSTNRRKRPSSQGSADRTPATGNRPSKPSDVLPKVPGSAPLKGALDGVGKILDGVVGGLPKAPQKPAGKDRDAGLLDFLLGP